MELTELERKVVGEPLTPPERAVAGLVAGFGAVGPVGLAVAGTLLLYTLLAVA